MRVGDLRWRVAIGWLLGIGALVHCQSLFVGFVADDFALVRAASGGATLMEAFPAGRGTYFRPVVMAALAIEHVIGSQPVMHHLVNLIAHLASGVMVFAIGRQIATKNEKSATPFVAAVIFLVHPIVAYDVNWISGRTDVFACFFSLIVLFSIARLTISQRRSFGILAAIALLFALASKEVAITTPLAAIALHIFMARGEERAKERLKEPAPSRGSRTTLLFLLAIALGWVALVYFRFYRTLDAQAQAQFSITTLLKGIAGTPILFVWPNSFWEVRHLLLTYPAVLPISAVLLLAPLALALRWLSRRHRVERRAVLALFVLATAPLLPLFIASLVPTTRLMYVPLATTCIALVGLRQIVEPPRRLVPITLVAIALMIVGSVLRGHRWVENSRLIATYCDDFIALRRDAPASSTPLFVTFPFELDDTPLFVHHTHSTLHACAPSDIKVSDAMIVVGPIVMARSPSGPVVRTERREANRIDFQIIDSGSFFGFEVPLAINTPLSFPEVTFTATEANNPREVRGLSTTFSPESIANADLLYFDGQHLRRIVAP